MACEIKIMCLVLIVSFSLNLVKFVYGEQKVPCYFIFGDSLFDNGNNNCLDTKAKVDFYPYGIDFPQGPTGRFTDGRNIADFIAEFLGFENYIPPFATAKGQEILKGANYASGAAGIREESGQHLGGRISLDRQLGNHKTSVSSIISLLGRRKSKEHLRNCIYTVGMGSNDYINNYFLPSFYPTTSLKYSPDQYAQLLIQQYSRQLTSLFKYGARKVGVFGLGDLGCAPFELELYGTNGTTCVEKIATAVQLFNNRLINLINYLNNKLRGANFIYVSQISTGDPSEAGFTETNKPCCIASGLIDKGHCVPDLAPCTNRNEYVYWDEFHPTELGMQILASTAFTVLSPFYNFSGDNNILGSDHGDNWTNLLVPSNNQPAF